MEVLVLLSHMFYVFSVQVIFIISSHVCIELCCVLLMVDVKSMLASSELQARVESSKQELDRYLGVYPYDRFLVLVLCYIILSVLIQLLLLLL